MNTLKECFENDFSKIKIIDRKIKIQDKKTIIKSASKVGATYVIYDFLSTFEKADYLYIDFSDYRNDKEEIKSNLENFIQENNIKVLVLENFDFSLAIPECENIIISTNSDVKIENFVVLQVYPLDFEEFLVYENKYHQTTQSFNYFLKYGNLPDIINLDENKKIPRLQEILKLQCTNQIQFEILKLLILNIDEKKSIFQLYNTLKKTYKISKDTFYNTCKNFETNNIVFFVKKYNQEKATKKIYCYNHSFLKTISHNKKFKNEFTNMIFLELKSKYNNIYYTDYIDFYLKDENLAVISIPFFNKLLMKSIINNIFKVVKELNIQQIYIITINNTDKIQTTNQSINILPFYEWALL